MFKLAIKEQISNPHRGGFIIFRDKKSIEDDALEYIFLYQKNLYTFQGEVINNFSFQQLLSIPFPESLSILILNIF